MLVFYSGWGYWEGCTEGEYGLEPEYDENPFGEHYGLFKLPEKAEMEVMYQGETTVSYLLHPKYSDLSNSQKYPLPEYPRFILCEERKGEQKFSIDERPIIKKTKRYTSDDIKDSPIDDAPKSLTETERNSMLRLILGMAIHGYGYDPDSGRNTATGSKNRSIKAALETLGLGTDEKTISKYLKEAAERYPDAKPRKI
jgi:hypothetical protein